MTISHVLAVTDASHVAEIRRAAVAAASAAELDEKRCNDASIVATELATNVLKHAGGGSLIIQPGLRDGVELLALDDGPGIPNLAKAMEDGFSTAGSPGTGLGAIARLSSAMDVYSQPKHGAVVYALLTNSHERADNPAPLTQGRGGFEASGICVPIKGESVCGDSFIVHDGQNGCLILVADGLGHGPLAADASRVAAGIFSASVNKPITTILADLHDALRATRGAAVSIAHIHPHQRTIRYCGIGNIIGAVVSDSGMRRMVSHNGTTGLGTPRIVEFTYPWDEHAALVMHSDGLATKWDLDLYPGLRFRHSALVAGVMFRDFARERDDATVVVVREVPS